MNTHAKRRTERKRICPKSLGAVLTAVLLQGLSGPGEETAYPSKVQREVGAGHWAYQPPRSSPPPDTRDAAWPWTDIDRHILAGLESKGLHPVGEADRATMLRRLCFDLTGLPPSPAELAAFLEDGSPGAYEAVVDRLLASERFGERWGRHWLDVARYGESSGKEVNIVYPHAWRYRDWVIDAFNQDLPYDQFLKEQLAGDLLPADNDTQRAAQLVATGYLALGPKSHNTRNRRQFALDLADEQIDALSQGMLGLTVACARCHDHKFDPISQEDYYALAGIFLSTETRFGTPRTLQNSQAADLWTLPMHADLPEAPAWPPSERARLWRQLESLIGERDEMLAQARASRTRPALNPKFNRTTIQIAVLKEQLDRYDEHGKPIPLAMGVRDRSSPQDARLLARGELDHPQQTVARGFVRALTPEGRSAVLTSGQGSGRLELADWVASKANPLTARVMANRIWLWLFGQGLVPTPDNFGVSGRPPLNQALLDHLAVSFVEHGWSVKTLIKQIVMSRIYRLSSAYDEANYQADPDNQWHWRMSQRRLDAESLRDAMLEVAGVLELDPPAGSPVALVEGNVLQALRGPGPLGGRLRRNRTGLDAEAAPRCRSVYLPIVRDVVPEALEVFDFAEPSLVVGAREETTVPAQALYLMNSQTVRRLSQAMAKRLATTQSTEADLLRRAYRLAYARSPLDSELQAAAKFFDAFRATEAERYSDRDQLESAVLAAFCQALLGSAEFRYLH